MPFSDWLRLCYFKMIAPRALLFRPLVRWIEDSGNEIKYHAIESRAHNLIVYYIITQVILAFRLVLAYDLLEYRCTIDVIITKFFPLCFKMAESFGNLDHMLHDWGKVKYKKVLSRHWTGTRSIV